MGVGVLFIVAALGLITLTLRVDFSNTVSQTGNELANDLINNVEAFASADWHNIDGLTPGTNYHLVVVPPFFNINTPEESVPLDDYNFTRYFTVDYVYRDDITNQIVTSGGSQDRSTFLITATVSWDNKGDTDSVVLEKYVARNRDRIIHEEDWSGGSGQEGPITAPNTSFATSTNAVVDTSILIAGLTETDDGSVQTNIDSVNKWAWNDTIGWIDSNITNNVLVSASGISGYASSSIGYIAFDCATVPDGAGGTTDICGTSNFGVTNTGGVLGGFAWNDAIGWIAFSGAWADGVTIDSNGYFKGYAWNDVIGWISFSCEDPGVCASSDYKTQTYWNAPPETATLTSSIFDTERVGGAAFNSIMWLGTKPNGTGVKFQISTSDNSSGPWTDSDFWGDDGTSFTYYQPSSWGVQEKIKLGGQSVCHGAGGHNNCRFIRYRVILESNENHTVSPKVEDIIINWSY